MTGQVQITNTEQHNLYSTSVQDFFSINVALPKNYKKNIKYPVIYLTDANIFFALAAQTSWLLQFGHEIPELIIVSIGYPDDSKHLHLRERDLLPSPGDQDPSVIGRSADFLKFIINELFPFIEERYLVDNTNLTLAGDSYGGLFALYVLFNQPEVFQRYIIGSPSIYWDNSHILKQESSYNDVHNDMSARVFLSVGELEAFLEPAHAAMVSNVKDLTQLLLSRKYKKLELTSHIFKNETHLSVIPATISRGLREVFREYNQT